MNLLNKLQSGLKKIPAFRRVAVAVSGGADSVALAYGLKELGYDIVIAHLDHQLRDESKADARLVRKLAKEWGVPCVIKKAAIPKTGNLENNARKIRYAFLEQVRKKNGADFIAVAHHLDDQIETVLMHMARGAGLRGQVGMKWQNGNIIRPLLHTPRKEVMEFIRQNRLSYRTDKSNFDLSRERNLWRHLVIPYLKKQFTLETPPASAAADTLRVYCLKDVIITITREAHKKLSRLILKASAWLSKYYADQQLQRKAFNRLSDELKTEILIQLLGAKDLYAKSIRRLTDFIQSGQTGKEMQVKGVQFILQPTRVLVFEHKVQGAPLSKRKLTVRGIRWGQWKIQSKTPQTLYARAWKAGDRFQPNGMKGTKKVQDFFVDAKIPRHLRKEIPIIVDENDIILSVGRLRLSRQAEKLSDRLTIEPLT